MEENLILISALKPQCEVLGPGKRYAIWVQGCPFACPGCIADSMHSFEEGRLIPIQTLAHSILETEDIEGITVSGGEPFAQPQELAELFRLLREKRNLGIIVYTGFLYEDLQALVPEHPEIGDMLSYIDLLVDGPFRQELNQNYGLKGSSNQRTILLTQRYCDALPLYNAPDSPRKVEWYTEAHQTFMAGVPSIQMMKQWKRLKQERGGHISPSIGRPLELSQTEKEGT